MNSSAVKAMGGGAAAEAVYGGALAAKYLKNGIEEEAKSAGGSTGDFIYVEGMADSPAAIVAGGVIPGIAVGGFIGLAAYQGWRLVQWGAHAVFPNWSSSSEAASNCGGSK